MDNQISTNKLKEIIGYDKRKKELTLNLVKYFPQIYNQLNQINLVGLDGIPYVYKLLRQPETASDRPFSESDATRPAPPVQRCRISASSPPLPLTFNTEDLDDDVFITPRSGNDLFSTRNLEIIGYNTPRSPAGVLLSPRRERVFNFVTGEKHWRDKGGTDMDGVADADEIDSSLPDESTDEPEGFFSSIIPDKISGSICTAVLFVLGWKLFSKR